MERLAQIPEERFNGAQEIIGAPQRALYFPDEQLFMGNDGVFMGFAN